MSAEYGIYFKRDPHILASFRIQSPLVYFLESWIYAYANGVQSLGRGGGKVFFFLTVFLFMILSLK